ncbi:Peptidoglycan-binding protein [uncultured Defluviicoccus sp.]|uniref:Peptidoglycan-binding protein n=1 Tax=metagenome TaxID=256318 RepID=A0A380TB53_9ZZZZ|nr:Peptidoglycan-binding protein [uncultured Defluviicoccus sp.]
MTAAMPQELAKATIRKLAGRGPLDEIPVLFNPAEYNFEISNSFQQIPCPGLASPILQFVNGETQTLSMDLFFDTFTDGGGEDVSRLTQQFADLLTIDADLHAPPPVEFHWGEFFFQAVIERLSQRFTMFNSDGRPVRATLSISFKQYRRLQEQLTNPRRNSADRTKSRVLTGDDSLWLMAAREYGEARFWRLIARHNRIANPRLLEPGTVLTLPPLPEPVASEMTDASNGA